MSAYTVVKKLLNNKIYNDIVLSIGIVIVIFTAVSRILSGMHYLTDVMGGLFLGLSLYFICDGIITIIDKKEVKEEI
jgi:undecaprenyl-diphosphatase